MKKLALAVAFTAVSFQAFAANQGNVGETSTGDTTITTSVNGKVRITNLDDINLGTWDGVSAQSGGDDVCVWSTTRSYKLTAKGSGDNNAFTLRGPGRGSVLAYTPSWSYDGQAAAATLVSGQDLTGQATNAKSATCNANGDKLAHLTINISSDELQRNGVIDNYQGVLTLTVAPI